MGKPASLNWGIIGPGGIARKFRDGLKDAQYGKLVAIATRDAARAGLAEDFPGARIHQGYEAMLTDSEVDAVYIALPHTGHAEWAIRCAEAGKHVLCEKPMSLTAYQADAMFAAAEKAGTFMAEAFMYRLAPTTKKLCDLIAAGEIGQVRMIRSNFGFALNDPPATHRLRASDLAGGGILDVGCYPASLSRLIAGVAQGQPFAEPLKVQGAGTIGPTGVDDWASALLTFPGGIIAEISCSVMLQQDNVLQIMGSTGRIELDNFWFGSGTYGGTNAIRIYPDGGEMREIAISESRQLWSFEADGVAEAIAAGKREFLWPGMSQADTLGNLRVLDKWRRDIGLQFAPELPAPSLRTLDGTDLTFGSRIPGRKIRDLSKPLSSVAIGFEDFPDFASVSILLDAYYQAGGNVFDTGFIYQGGVTETVLGQWLASRGLRDQAVIIGKGAHSPLCYPDVIAKQLAITLDRLQSDHIDIYFMHRDNPDVPVGEFVDAMDAQVRAGHIRGPFGGSNWSRERMDAAIAYAKANGKFAPSVLSNNFSLADMVAPVWAGCVAASDAAWTDWMQSRGITNFAWSSQARGFFTPRAGRGQLADSELARSWYSETNFQRRDRAVELAAKLGTTPIRVALAYVLAHQAGILPLIGPRRLVELEDSLMAVDLKLTQDQVAWLRG